MVSALSVNSREKPSAKKATGQQAGWSREKNGNNSVDSLGAAGKVAFCQRQLH